MLEKMLQRFLGGTVESNPRVLSNRSTREIMDTMERIGRELRAALYFYNERLFIASAITGVTEAGSPVVLTVDDTDDALGLAICDKLLEFDRHSPRGREAKLADWQSFTVSGAKTGKYFEANSIYFTIKTVNTAICLEARPRVSLRPEFHAGAQLSVGAEHERLGAAVRRLILAVKALRQASVL
jgi:hypothetical protein